MREVKLALIRDDQPERIEVDASFIQSMSPADEDGITLICGGCEKSMVEGFATGFMVMAGVDLVCQHCEAHNYLDTTAL
ncbi:MAG TPA: hypothetical protein VGN75_04635 [Kaistia sp.]|nr:hypothetical protein [Kaistia sp.]